MSKIAPLGNAWDMGMFVSSQLDDAGLDVFEFRIYANLCRRANDEARSWPSLNNIAAICKISTRKVREALRSLEAKGMVETIANVREDGGQGANTYRVCGPPPRHSAPTPRHQVPTPPAPSADPPRHQVPTPPGTTCRPLEGIPREGSPVEGSPEKVLAHSANERPVEAFFFELWFEKTFWLAYPRKVGKARAKSLLHKKVKTQHYADRVMSGLSLWLESREWQREGGQYIPHGDTWCSSEGWLDSPAPASSVATHGNSSRTGSGNARSDSHSRNLAASGVSGGESPTPAGNRPVLQRPPTTARPTRGT